MINVSRNSDKNDNMFRYFERYQIKYELYLKFLDVISNDDPKNVLLSSYIEEMFVDVLSKIPYFYMSRIILVCYNQRKLRNLLFKYQKHVQYYFHLKQKFP